MDLTETYLIGLPVTEYIKTTTVNFKDAIRIWQAFPPKKYHEIELFRTFILNRFPEKRDDYEFLETMHVHSVWLKDTSTIFDNKEEFFFQTGVVQ